MFAFQFTGTGEEMAKPRIIWILDQLGKVANEKIERLNYGGCGVFAGQVGAMLQYVDGVENVRIRIGNTWGVRNNKSTVNELIEQSNATKGEIGNVLGENGICNGHLCVEFEYKGVHYFYDSTGCRVVRNPNLFERRPLTTFHLYEGFLTPELTLDYAEETVHWNSEFDRKQIPKLTRLIEQYIGEAASY